MPPRPRLIRVAGRPYKVRSGKLPDALGLCDPNTGTITLARHTDRFSEQDTVLHETMHAVLRQQGRPYTEAEEEIVTALATGLLGVLHDNPRLTAYLTCANT